MDEKKGWFADVDPHAGTRFIWQPCLQLEGSCMSLEIWFETEEACLEFIRDEILKLGMLDES